MRTLLRDPVPLDVRLLALLGEKLEGVHAKACAADGMIVSVQEHAVH